MAAPTPTFLDDSTQSTGTTPSIAMETEDGRNSDPALTLISAPMAGLETVTNNTTGALVMPVGETLTEFHLFPRLPIEMRLRIFYAARALHPRTIHLGSPIVSGISAFSEQSQQNAGMYRACHLTGVHASHRPIMLAINRECRTEMLKHFQDLFRIDNLRMSDKPYYVSEQRGMRDPKAVLIDFDMDTIFFANELWTTEKKAYRNGFYKLETYFGDNTDKFIASVQKLALPLYMCQDIRSADNMPHTIPITNPVKLASIPKDRLLNPFQALDNFKSLKQLLVMRYTLDRSYILVGFEDTLGETERSEASMSPDDRNLKKWFAERVVGLGVDDTSMVNYVQPVMEYRRHKSLVAKMGSAH